MRSSRIAKPLSSSSLLLLLAALAAGATGAAEARDVRDATGTTVRLPERATRIVTLAPSLGELAADLAGDALERIVGVSDYSDYPPALAKIPSVGSYARFNIEKVVSLKPDLVLATTDGNPKDQVLHLRELGVPVVVVGTETLAEVEGSVRLVARAMGEEKRGEAMAAQLHLGIEHLRAKVAAGGTRRVLLQIGDDPLVVVGAKSFLHDAVRLVGGTNVYADASAHYPRPSLEDVLKRDPEVVIVLALGGDLAPFHAMASRWGRFAGISAVKAGRVRVLQGDMILRPTLRLLEGLSLLEKAVHE
jgi:iron complex transport system substrate-binding protein